uniref:ribonuclease H n=1 Tax=Anas zonorhyncha TaxID=75864 RepID=A0A8B9VKH1_9AVES
MPSSINQSATEITTGLSEQSADGEWGLPSPPPAPENLDEAVLPASVPLPGSNKSTRDALPMRGAEAACENLPSVEELFQELLVKLENLKIAYSEELLLSSAPPEPTRSLSIPTPPSAPRRDRCSDVICDAIIEGHWHATSLACPINIDPVQGTGSWQPHDWKLSQQAPKTVMDYGLQSQVAQQIFQWIFQAELMCPLDSQNLSCSLLTPSQLLLFEREWLQLPQGEVGQLHQPWDPLYGITAEMLMGMGPYLNTQVQLQFPVIIHQTAAQLALRALLSLPGEKKAPPFSSLEQGPGEPYDNFIDQLWAAIPDHPDLTAESKSSVFKMLAFDNANPKTQNILVTLLRTVAVEDMLVQRADQSRQPDVVAQDCQRFAFTVPSINKQAPAKHYEWLVLLQGMRNSPTLCQLYVTWALEPIWTAWCDIIIYHYMDNIRFGRPECFQDSDLKFIKDTLEAKGLKTAPEKVQQKQPWLYLGWKMSDSTIRPQIGDITMLLHNLTDVQMFLDNIQRGCHIVRTTNDALAILLPLLRCRSAEPQITLTNDHRQALSQIASKVAAGTACSHIADITLSFLISNHASHPFAVNGQWQKEKGESKGRQR